MIIAIDGPAGAGKSSVAKEIASALDMMRLDTGALYRAIALACQQSGLSTTDPQLSAFVLSLDLAVKDGDVFLSGTNVSSEIRTTEISAAASKFAAIPAVRDSLLDVQRRLASSGKFVVDGRDIGTVVFPDASIKIFLTASVESRAKRRFLDYAATEGGPTLDEVKAAILERDQNDSQRAVAPLRQADDAVLVDSSDLSLKETVKHCLALISRRLGQAGISETI